MLEFHSHPLGSINIFCTWSRGLWLLDMDSVSRTTSNARNNEWRPFPPVLNNATARGNKPLWAQGIRTAAVQEENKTSVSGLNRTCIKWDPDTQRYEAALVFS